MKEFFWALKSLVIGFFIVFLYFLAVSYIPNSRDNINVFSSSIIIVSVIVFCTYIILNEIKKIKNDKTN